MASQHLAHLNVMNAGGLCAPLRPAPRLLDELDDDVLAFVGGRLDIGRLIQTARDDGMQGRPWEIWNLINTARVTETPSPAPTERPTAAHDTAVDALLEENARRERRYQRTRR